MLITSMLPLLSRYSLTLDLSAGPDAVTVTIVPRKAAGSKHDLDGGETRPISFTGTAAEIDAELEKGADGALGQLIAARKSLADQIAEQRDTAEKAKTLSAAKTKPAAKTAAKPTEQPKAAEKPTVPADSYTPPPGPLSAPGEPASLW
ncbi:PRTRC system protein E [uncultured Sphingomonas sp.]|uniref:PRTRC system protein E n=1 Tax=uncultured Sphingomonas sp. TaxID=158754 RepID=UPI0025D71A34|nr:PRTRC system protein E [uncultured Sphingomonas sp.]